MPNHYNYTNTYVISVNIELYILIPDKKINLQGALKIAELLELAKKEIPEKYWAKTPLVLKATAGLRILPQEQADNILSALKELFKKTPFLTDENSIEIMDGTDEGIFSWFTVNFLLSVYHVKH